MEHVCRICGNACDNRAFVSHEMMFGTREPFDYFECSACGCVQIGEIPADPGRHYPSDYYSISPRERSERSRFRQRLDIRTAVGGLSRSSVLDRVLTSLRGVPDFIEWARTAHVGLGDPILDVGCGAGRLLQRMAEVGFENLTGIDPYVEADLGYESGVRVYRRDLAEEPDRYRFVMLHHTIEHLPDPDSALRNARRVLEPDGCLLIRTPVTDGFAWQEYGVDWVQLDAPRHICLFSQRAMQTLAEQTGFTVERVVHDSTAFQFWGSELCRREIPQQTRSDGGRRSPRHHFSKSQLRAFRRRAVRLNREGRGDQVCFYLRPTLY